jgi:hypothetical protein
MAFILRELSMYAGFRFWLVIYFAAVAAPYAWTKTTSPTEINAYAVMDGYKIPFKMRTEADTSKNIQKISLTLDMTQIPTINLTGPIDKRVNYKSEISKISLCGMSDKRVCLNVLSNVELDTLLPVWGKMTFSCLFEIVNRSGKLSVEKVDVNNLHFDSWVNGFTSVIGGEETVAERIKTEIEKQFQAKKLDLSGVGLLSELKTKTIDSNLELSLKLKNRAPALKVFQTALAQKSGNRVEIDEEQPRSDGYVDQTGRTAYRK